MLFNSKALNEPNIFVAFHKTFFILSQFPANLSHSVGDKVGNREHD